MTRKLLVKPWEVITCPNNHPMFIAVRSIYADSSNDYTRLSVVQIGVARDYADRWICPTCKKWAGSRTIDGVGQLTVWVQGEKRNWEHYIEEATETTD